jgi:hypothetical protein
MLQNSTEQQLCDMPHVGDLDIQQGSAVGSAHLGDGGGVGDHADSALDLGEVAAGHDGGRLVVDAALEAGGAPVHKLDRTLGLDGRHRRVHVLGHDISAVHQAARHVLCTAASTAQHACDTGVPPIAL